MNFEANVITLFYVYSVPWRVLSTMRVFSTVEDVMSTVGDIMSTVGDILSTVEDTQYRGRI